MAATSRPDVPIHLKVALTPIECEQLTGLSAEKVRRLVYAGQIGRVPHTTRLLIPRVELDRWVTSGTKAGAS